MILLVGSALFLASFARLINVDLGLDHEDVLTVQVRVSEAPTNIQQALERNRRLLLNVLDRVRAIPGVEVASLLGGGLPLRGDLRTVDSGPGIPEEYRYCLESDFAGLLQGHQGTPVEGAVLYRRR